jgi:hypothetical protein
LAATAFLALTAEDGIRRDELHCEEAKKRIMDCCGYASYPLDCTYTAGCGSVDYPDLDERTAICLRDASCDDLKPFCNAPGYLCQ